MAKARSRSRWGITTASKRARRSAAGSTAWLVADIEKGRKRHQSAVVAAASIACGTTASDTQQRGNSREEADVPTAGSIPGAGLWKWGNAVMRGSGNREMREGGS